MKIARKIFGSSYEAALGTQCIQFKPGGGPDNALDKDKQPSVWRWKNGVLERMEPGLNANRKFDWFWNDMSLTSSVKEAYPVQVPGSYHSMTGARRLRG